MTLSKRLQAVASYVTKGKTAADIGCDHGYVPIYLVRSGISPHVIAADIREGPLNRAKEHIAVSGYGDRIETRLSDGLREFSPKEVQSLIISGIGGMLLMRILREGEPVARSADELILSPQSDLPEVRRFLKENGYCIREEAVVLDEGKYYHIFYVHPKPDEHPWSEADFTYGCRYAGKQKRTTLDWLLHESEKNNAIRSGIEKNASDDPKNERILGSLEKQRMMLEEKCRELENEAAKMS